HGTLVTCPAGQVCVTTTGNCVPKPCSADANCNDGNPCTIDTCAGGLCTITSGPNGVTPGCTDSDACNGTEMCHDGVCMPGTQLTCDDPQNCTDGCDPIHACIPIPGCCRTPAECPGSNVCTSCVDNVCGVIQGCCTTNADCQDRLPCQTGTCTLATNLCTNALIDPFALCTSCSVDIDCDVIGRCHGLRPGGRVHHGHGAQLRRPTARLPRGMRARRRGPTPVYVSLHHAPGMRRRQ